MSRDLHTNLPKPRQGPGCFWWLLSLGLLTVVAVLLLPSVNHGGAHRAARFSGCVNNLKQIGIALQTYHDAYKTFPPAVINDEHGIPMHSWRAVLLPFFESNECRRLAAQYRFNEPWNGPNNRKLLDQMPSEFRCRMEEQASNQTSYLAVVGPETMWRGVEPMNIREITDGTSKTIAVVECSDSGVNWLEPRDMAFDDAAWGINNRSTRPAFRSNHTGGAMALFVDSSVHFLSNDIKPDILRGLLTPAGGEDVQVP